MDIIDKRRSIRKYTGEPVSESQIEQLLHAAMNAPSAHNQQAWHFYIIRNRKKLITIAEKHKYAKMMRTAAGAFLVCGNREIMKIEDLWEQDCAAATQNILLESVHMGLGTCWVGISHRKEYQDMLRELFNLPENHIPFALIAYGHPDEEKVPNNNFSEDKISWDQD